MNPGEFLQGQLERLFELDGMMALSSELLGVEPAELGGTTAKGAFARALVRHCETHDGLDVLAEAIRVSATDRDAPSDVLPAADEELAPGTQVRAYRIVERIARAPLASVYLAERARRDGDAIETVQLKVFRKEVTRDRIAAWRLLTAARAIAELRDPGLVGIIEAGTLRDGRVFLTTEAVRGQALSTRIARSGPLSLGELRPVVRTLVSGLALLHERGLLHGYLNADDLILVRPVTGEASERGQLLGVLDGLGVARLLEGNDEGVPGVLRVVGDPTTLAPEVARGQRATPESEVYALGCLLYYALTGASVFDGATPLDQVLAHLYEEPVAPSLRVPRLGLSTELDAVILRALAKQPSERYESVRALGDALVELARASVPPRSPSSALELTRLIESLRDTPDDPALAAELEQICSESGEYQLVVDAFVAAAGETDDAALKKQLLLRGARIAGDQLDDRRMAAALLEQVLALEPGDAQAQDALEELHRAGNDYEALIGVLLDRLDGEPSAEARGKALREIAQLYDEKLDQPDNALLAYTQALTEEPDDLRTRRAIERLAAEPAKLQDVLASLHESLTNGEFTPEHRVQLNVVVASWSAHQLGRLDAALPYLHEALRIDPAHEPALEALSALYRKAEAWGELFTLLMRRAESAASPARQRAFQAEAAGVANEKLRDASTAQAVYEEVLAGDPTHPEALAALEELYVKAGQRTKLLGLLEKKLEALHGSERAETLCALAVLQDHDAHERARDLYERALAADERHMPAYQGLEELCIGREDIAGLAKVLERQLAIATTPQQRIALLERMASTEEDLLAEPARAVAHYEQIVALYPAHEAANVALARLYRPLHRFEDLIETYDRQAKSTEDPARKVELLMSAARVMIADIGSPDRASLLCERVLALAPNHAEALLLSARIRAHSGDSFAAVDALDLLAEAEADPQRTADLRVRAGQLLETEGNLDGAIARYQRALEAWPSYPAALSYLARIYQQRGDARGEAELLLREAELASDPVRKAELFVALGALRQDRLGDKPLAYDAYRRAYELAPLSKDALLGLGRLALEDERWEEAIACLEPLLDHTTGLPNEVAVPILRGAGEAFRALGFLAKAERCYLSAKALAPDDRLVNERLAELALQGGRPDAAAELLQGLLDEGSAHAATLTFAERRALTISLGRARKDEGDLERAARAFQDVLAADPDAVDALEALAEVQEAAGDLEALVRTLERLIGRTSAPEAHFALLVRAGDLHAQLGHRQEASDLFVKALELHADDRNVLSKLMAVYSAGKNWARLVEVLVKMAKVVVDDLALSAKYLLTAAGVAQTELRDLNLAVKHYEEALSLHPGLEAAFRGQTECLKQAGAWDRLATAVRAQIERQRDVLDEAREGALWRELGSIYHDRLHRLDPAIEAYEQASALSPDDRALVERLVELYGRSPSRFADNAIAAHARLLAQNTFRAESYRALRKLYTQLSRADEAWCVCQALRSLSMAEPEEEAFFKRHRVQAPATARECITEELWGEYLSLPEQDDTVTRLFALIQPAAIQALGQSPEVFGISRERPVDCQRAEATMAQMLHYAAGVMLVPLPQVYLRPRDAGGVSFLFTDPPALGLGRGALTDAPDQALAFLAGRQLSYFRPGHYMRQLVPTGSGLRSWLLSAVRLSQPRFPVPETMRAQVERCQLALSHHLHAPQQQALGSLIEQLLREQPELDMKRWALSLDLLADRVGFVLANSLDAAVAMVRASPPDSSFAGERERLKALYQYAVSPNYLALRKAIGVTVS